MGDPKEEVHAEPTQARVVLIRHEVLAGESGAGSMSPILGTLEFEQYEYANSQVRITGEIYDLSPGKHGFHIHEKGNIVGGCKSAGGHFNPENQTHGDIWDSVRHVGDLGNIETDFNTRETYVSILDTKISLRGPHSIIGRAVVVHAGEDDLGCEDEAQCDYLVIQKACQPFHQGSSINYVII